MFEENTSHMVLNFSEAEIVQTYPPNPTNQQSSLRGQPLKCSLHTLLPTPTSIYQLT